MHLKTKHFLSEKYKVLNWLLFLETMVEPIKREMAQTETEYCINRMEEVITSKYKIRLIHYISITNFLVV